jgi:hypothetical protein
MHEAVLSLEMLFLTTLCTSLSKPSMEAQETFTKRQAAVGTQEPN